MPVKGFHLGGIVGLHGHGAAHIITADGRQLPAQVLAERGGIAFSTVVTGSKVRWVLDLMRGTEFAGNNVGHVDTETVEADGIFDVSAAAGPNITLGAPI